MKPLVAEIEPILDRAGELKILVLGDLILDEYLWGRVERISPEAPVQVVEWQSSEWVLGGAANVAANLAAVGVHVIVGGIVGSDPPGEQILKLLEGRGIQHEGVVEDPQRPTTHKVRVIAHSQQVVRIDREVHRDISGEVEQELIDWIGDILPGVHGVICSDYMKGALSPSVLAFVAGQARTMGKWLLVDPKGKDYGRYRGAHVLTPNLKEAELACGRPLQSEREIEEGGQSLIDTLGLEAVLITRGRDGLSLCTRGLEGYHLPAAAREVYDVTGAGDTAISFFALALFAGADLKTAAHLPNGAAGIVVGKVGTATVGREELLAHWGEEGATSRSKVVSRPEAVRVRNAALSRGQKLVFTNGCFDLLHAGHIKFLEQARSLGDLLIVGLNDDASVRALKGPERPLIGQEERARILAALNCVDYVTLFSELTPEQLIAELKPDVLAKGADYTREQVVGRNIVESYGGLVELIPLVEGRSTSGLVQAIVEKYNSSGKNRKRRISSGKRER